MSGQANNRIRISFDQNAAHHILAQWKEKALADPSLSGIEAEAGRQDWASQRIRELDQAFDRSLGLRMSDKLRADVVGGCHLDAGSSLVDKKTQSRMWRRNISGANKKRGRAPALSSAKARPANAKEDAMMEEGQL